MPGTRRLFFALWPTQEVRHLIHEQLARLDLDSSVRAQRFHNLHMTLHFLGSVDPADVDCLHHAAMSVEADSFRLTLDHYDRFEKARVLWIGPRVTPDALLKLNTSLGTAINHCGFDPEQRIYRPHVTLIRKYGREEVPSPANPIHWFVDRFVLAESVSADGGVDYQVVETYQLS